MKKSESKNRQDIPIKGDETGELLEIESGHGGRFEKIPSELPLQPLINTVIFPSMVAPLVIGKQRSILAVQKAMEGSNILATFLLKSGHEEKEEIKLEDIHTIGTAVGILKMLRMPDQTLRVMVQGLKRIKIQRISKKDGFFVAKVKVLEEEFALTDRLEALRRAIGEKFKKVVSLASYLPDEIAVAVDNITDPFALVYMITSVTNMKTEKKQKILAIDDFEKKMENLLAILNKEEKILEIGGKIESEVAGELSKTQREYFLREQLKAIKKELGETGSQETEILELMDRIAKKKLPDEVREVADKELKRMEGMPSVAPEYYVIRTYLEWILDLPWMEATIDDLDLKKARDILDKDHYGLDEVKERIIEYLAVRKLKEDTKGQILCFIGPPGVGKTSLGQSIARALGRKFIRISLGGVHDEAAIRGHRRTYVGALPGRIVQGIKRAGTKNPIFMLDEIDKVGADFRGDPSSALLEVLDPEQNIAFIDHYLDLPFDLSQVIFIATGNVILPIQPALRDRMEVMNLPGYVNEEKVAIAKRYLIPKQLEAHGLNPEQLVFEEKSIEKIIAQYTQEAGVRNLERQIARICRKVAYKIATDEQKRVRITIKNLPKFLGPQKVFHETARRTAIPGVATGLAWTESGGEILFVEVIKMPGKKGLNITGQLGEVMQESVKTALSFVRSIASKYNIDQGFFEDMDLHIHIPAGAIPKDGPSAGVALATAITSALTGRPVKKEIAMTGEATLSGLVLPVGGIREKVLAAKREGIKKVILPSRNRLDVEEIPKDLLKGIKFSYIENIEDGINLALT
ncbi:MAG: endopeptidase La [bacterium]